MERASLPVSSFTLDFDDGQGRPFHLELPWRLDPSGWIFSMTDNHPRMTRKLLRLWPWLLLALMALPAIWHVIDFPSDIDGEYPKVERPTFSARPPAAYRLAEPGDTIDRVALYASSAILAVSALAWILSRKAQLWPVAMVIGLFAGWLASTPEPCYDGWHGLGWQVISDSSAPISLRLGLVIAAIALIGIALFAVSRVDLRQAMQTARERRALSLLIVATILLAGRTFEIPGVEPVGYWPRWSFSLGLIALGLAIVRLLPRLTVRKRMLATLGSAVACFGLILIGLEITWMHRPLERLHAVVPGKIYISAMPTYRGLELEQSRLHFKTIINLFPEESLKDKLSSRLPDERKFAEEHNIRYVGSPGTAIDSDTFLDETLALARDPNAWPILVHCHGCMDRSPAWMGIYRFVVQDRPLDEIMKEIEAHRGVRPKASVTLLYNRVLPERAPDHYAADPTAAILKQATRGTVDPYEQVKVKRTAEANPDGPEGVPRR